MAITDGYLALQDLKDYIGDGLTGVKHEAALEAAVTSASRLIDQHCERRFYADASATARTYWAFDARTVLVDDISTLTGLVVKVDRGDDGTYEETVTSTNYMLYPLNGVIDGIAGWPYTRLVLPESVMFPTLSRRPPVQITARWGWATVPAAVEQACKIIGYQLFTMKDAPFGVAGFGADTFSRRVGTIPAQAETLLAPYRKASAVAQAFA